LGEVSVEGIENHVFGAVEKVSLAKEQEYGAEAFYGVARIIYLQTIDQLWKEHLRDMDHLREGISLRGYAQKDPKQEYKKEGYNLFVAMMGTITSDVLQKAFRVIITRETEEDYQARLERQREKQQKLMKESAPPAPTTGVKKEAPAAPSEDDGPDVMDKVKRDVSANKKKRDRRKQA
jgi:preprotein translocase subunit SecA